MASVLVYIEADGDRPQAEALEALGEGRRIATSLGATLYAFAAVAERFGSGHNFGHDEIVAALGRGGADRVVIMTAPAYEGPALWNNTGPLLAAAVEHLQPNLVLLPATEGGLDIAPRLAARIRAAYVAEPSIECGPRGEIVLTTSNYGGNVRRRLAADDLETPIVCTLTPGSYARAHGDDDAEVLFLEAPVTLDDRIRWRGQRDDPGADLARASIVVTAGCGVGDAAGLALVASLAEALGGTLAATRSLSERGLAPRALVVGVGAREIAPSLYVACGASGSASHLAGVSPDAEIIAINSDPDAPIFRAASYGIVGELAEVIPALIEALRGHAPLAASS